MTLARFHKLKLLRRLSQQGCCVLGPAWRLRCCCHLVTNCFGASQVFYLVCYEQYRPPIPEGMPPEYQQLMRECWAPEFEARPRFSDISPRLQVEELSPKPTCLLHFLTSPLCCLPCCSQLRQSSLSFQQGNTLIAAFPCCLTQA